MKTTTWTVLLGIFAGAMVLDVGTWSLCAPAVRATDLGLLAQRAYTTPALMWVAKAAVVAGMVGLGWLARTVSSRAELGIGLLSLLGAAWGLYGAYTNVAYGWH